MNYCIYGNKNNFRVEKNEFWDIIPKEELDFANDQFVLTPYMIHVAMKLPSLTFEYQHAGGNRVITLTSEELEMPWLELDRHDIILRRESLQDIHIDFFLRKRRQNFQYRINNGQLITKTDNNRHICKHTLFNFKFMKVYFEFDSMITNCLEINKEKYKRSYLVGVNVINEGKEFTLEPPPQEFLMDSFYITFRDEEDNQIPIKQFLAYFNINYNL